MNVRGTAAPDLRRVPQQGLRWWLTDQLAREELSLAGHIYLRPSFLLLLSPALHASSLGAHLIGAVDLGGLARGGGAVGVLAGLGGAGGGAVGAG